MQKKKKTILVTGGAGYIGSHTIAELILAGYDVVSVDNFSNSSAKTFTRLTKLTGKKVKNYPIDLCDYKKIKKTFPGKKFDGIIHFAAWKAVGESVEKPLAYYENNLGSLVGALHIAKLCHTNQFIFSSSCAVYDPKETPPYTEDSKCAPASPYGMTKFLGEMLLRDYTTNTPHFSSVSLRYFNPAGAHPTCIIGEEAKKKTENLVPIIIKAVKTKKPFTIFGKDYETNDGTCVRDYIHVSDVAKAHVAALAHVDSKEAAQYEVFNIGTGVGVTVQEMVRAFESVNTLKVPFVYGPRRAGDMAAVYANTKKAEKKLGWKPEYSLADIMKTAWEWGQMSAKNTRKK